MPPAVAGLIRRETGFQIPKMILRYDGLPITPESIFQANFTKSMPCQGENLC